MPVIKSLLSTVLCFLMFQSVYAWGPGYGGYPGYGAPYGTAPERSVNVRAGMQIEKLRDERGYVLRVYLTGIDPKAIAEKVAGSTLLLRSNQASMSRQSGNYGTRSFSHSFSMNRRIPLPFDADVSRISRSDSPELIEIVILVVSRR